MVLIRFTRPRVLVLLLMVLGAIATSILYILHKNNYWGVFSVWPPPGPVPAASPKIPPRPPNRPHRLPVEDQKLLDRL
ncbi:hypothetical protein BX661DRAFT_187684, partial [Kickxella alabastrina]|uniref:uncharacterized protein n=1 Tax=Kickxella alabastrina TaxID=61397 RepID=UPI0022211056